jgi:hypothetical protein
VSAAPRPPGGAAWAGAATDTPFVGVRSWRGRGSLCAGMPCW